jgi:hypothetical protein
MIQKGKEKIRKNGGFTKTMGNNGFSLAHFSIH